MHGSETSVTHCGIQNVIQMTGLWFCYGLLIIGLLYYVSYDVFLGEMNSSVKVENNRTADTTTEYNAVSTTSRLTFTRRWSTRAEIPNKVNRATDIFDYCPFEPPDPWHKSIIKYMDDKYGYLKNCTPDSNLSPVTDLMKGRVTLKKGKEAFACQGRCINYAGDNQYDLGNWKSIKDEVFKCDFVETECKSGKTTKRYIHMQIAEQKSSTNSQLNRQQNPDVVIMVIDSVASTQLIRGLPRTVNFLLHGMEAIEFRKFNKVGSNSRPNAFAALIGKTTEPVPRKPMNLPTIPADLSYEQYCKSYLDNETYIPLMYKKKGYKMFGAEDYVTSILNYPNCLGTKTRQFEHSFRPFHTRLNKDSELERIHLGGSCRLVHDNMLEYLEHYVNAYKDSPKFSLTWFVDLAHDDTKLIYRSDYELYNFYLKNREALNNSFIFFFGDHGPRFGSEAYTKFGNSEANNPFLYVVLPKHLRHTEVHEQILANSKELVTHHDLHSTLEDILYNQPSAAFSDLSFKRFDSDPRGSSLLRKFESGVARTCKTLPIPFQYCICQYKKTNVTDGKLVEALGSFAAKKLAAILESEKVASSCEKITLSNVIEALEFVLPHKNATQFEVSLYEVTFNVSAPALGVFKIPIRRESRGKFELAGEQFDRLDKYGKHGDCMKKDILRPLCTCKIRSTSKP
ncbi:hypothetical protein GCK32_003376 [Trichostrongylus colubriformis]|uniref:Uncharacterized protein n=1 Tax=Trichostrongylus colubriformis TaxID=6319 RepID=A0AAN8FAD6_TRICO